MITIIDYGMGNLASVSNAMKIYTDKVRVSSKAEDIKNSDKIVLPGVGAFKHAYDELGKRDLIGPILDFISSGKPFLGVCLGMQLLFSKSYEDGECKGLDVIKGDVIAFDKKAGLKIPHMGWNVISQKSKVKSQKYKSKVKSQKCPLLSGIPDGAYMYFVHSYYVVPEDKNVIATVTDYGVNFCSMLWKDNIYAMQFHPEKSQKEGLKIIENFVKL